MELSRFNIRVYGLLEWKGKILLVHEQIGDYSFTKFPGGGLELGEGTHDCLIREFKEETHLHVRIGKHIYTTDFFQQSAFSKTDQIISVYYEVHAIDDPAALRLDAFEIEDNGRLEKLQFFWLDKELMHPDRLTLPIDKHVAGLLI